MPLTVQKLEEVGRGLAAGNIAPLLTAWREQRTAELAAAVSRVPGKPAPRLPRGSEQSMVAWTSGWPTTRLEDRGPLATQLVELLSGSTHRYAKATLRFVAEQPADPRLGTAIAETADVETNALLRPMVQRELRSALSVHADRRHVTLLERLARQASGAEQRRLDARARELRKVQPLEPKVASRLRGLKFVPSAEVPALADELWAAVYEQPANLQLRAVLADALQEAGDARGEFIARQLQGKSAEPSPELGRHLLGPIADAVQLDSVRWKNGFPVSGSINPKMTTPRLQVALQAREWATFEELFGLQRLSPHLRSLRVTGALPDKALEEWVRKGWPIPLRAAGVPIELAALVGELPSPLEKVTFTRHFVDDFDPEMAFFQLKSAPRVRDVVFDKPTYVLGAGAWPLWSERALLRESLERITWKTEEADFVVENRGKRFDTLVIELNEEGVAAASIKKALAGFGCPARSVVVRGPGATAMAKALKARIDAQRG